MLEVLRGHEVSDVVAVVSRWFGGTLLGAGGLVRAYGDAVRLALADSGTLTRELVRELTLDVDHADAGRVESELRNRGVAVLDTTYAAQRHPARRRDAGRRGPAARAGGRADRRRDRGRCRPGSVGSIASLGPCSG